MNRPHSVVAVRRLGKSGRSVPAIGRALHHRLLATLVGAAVAGGGLGVPAEAWAWAPESSSMSDSTKVKDLNNRAQQTYGMGDFRAAAGSWSEILGVLPENRTNREERETTLLVALDAYVRAYESRKDEPGDRAAQDALESLRLGVATFDKYESEYVRVYGSGAQVSLEAGQAGKDIRDLYADAKARLHPTPEAKPDPVPVEPPIIVGSPYVPDRPGGLGLIIGGSGVIVAGLGTSSMIIVGAIMSRRASRESADATTDEEVAKVDRKGKTGDALIISGAVLTGVLLAGGATMLAFGIKRRIRYLAVTPDLNRGYAGLSLQGRF